MGGQIKAVERLAPGGLEHQRGPPRSRTSSKSGLADAPSSSSLSPYSYAIASPAIEMIGEPDIPEDAIGGDAIPPCRGSIQENWQELKPQEEEEGHVPM